MIALFPSLLLKILDTTRTSAVPSITLAHRIIFSESFEEYSHGVSCTCKGADSPWNHRTDCRITYAFNLWKKGSVRLWRAIKLMEQERLEAESLAV